MKNDAPSRGKNVAYHPYIFFGEVPVQPFFLLKTKKESFAYCLLLRLQLLTLLWICPLSDTGFANIFLSVYLIFSLFWQCLLQSKSWKFYPLSLISLMDYIFLWYLKKNNGHAYFLLFSSIIFIALHFIFGSLILSVLLLV